MVKTMELVGRFFNTMLKNDIAASGLPALTLCIKGQRKLTYYDPEKVLQNERLLQS